MLSVMHVKKGVVCVSAKGGRQRHESVCVCVCESR